MNKDYMDKDFNEIIMQVKTLISQEMYDECETIISLAMLQHSHSPIPHNLMGLLLEAKECHHDAVKHFRAACDLDPSYKPAEHNLESFGAFTRTSPAAYFESDCEIHKKAQYHSAY